jgi:hypothetical protein
MRPIWPLLSSESLRALLRASDPVAATAGLDVDKQSNNGWRAQSSGEYLS